MLVGCGGSCSGIGDNDGGGSIRVGRVASIAWFLKSNLFEICLRRCRYRGKHKLETKDKTHEAFSKEAGRLGTCLVGTLVGRRLSMMTGKDKDSSVRTSTVLEIHWHQVQKCHSWRPHILEGGAVDVGMECAHDTRGLGSDCSGVQEGKGFHEGHRIKR